MLYVNLHLLQATTINPESILKVWIAPILIILETQIASDELRLVRMEEVTEMSRNLRICVQLLQLLKSATDLGMYIVTNCVRQPLHIFVGSGLHSGGVTNIQDHEHRRNRGKKNRKDQVPAISGAKPFRIAHQAKFE